MIPFSFYRAFVDAGHRLTRAVAISTCSAARKFGIPVFHEQDLIETIREIKAEQQRTAISSQREFVAVNPREIFRSMK